MLLTLRRASGQRDEHDDRPYPADPSHPAVEQEHREEREQHAEHDQHTIDELAPRDAIRGEVIEVGDLVREDGRRLVRLEQIQQRVAHGNRRPPDRRQRNGIHEPGSGRPHAVHSRRGRPGAVHDLREPRRQRWIVERRGRVRPQPDPRIPLLDREQHRRQPDGQHGHDRPALGAKRVQHPLHEARDVAEDDPEAEAAGDGQRRVAKVRPEAPRFAQQARAERIRGGDQQCDQ